MTTQQNLTEEIKPEPVDEAAIRRKAAWDGMKQGVKRGALWGSIVGLGGAVLASSIAYTGVMGAAKAGGTGLIAMIAKVPVIGLPLAGGLGYLGFKAVSGGGAGEAISEVLGTVAAISVKATLIGSVVGIGIGAAVGAINGYMNADEKVEQAQLIAKREAKQKNIERMQALRAQEQLLSAEQRFDQQTEQLGNLSSPPMMQTQTAAPEQGTPRGGGFGNLS